MNETTEILDFTDQHFSDAQQVRCLTAACSERTETGRKERNRRDREPLCFGIIRKEPCRDQRTKISTIEDDGLAVEAYGTKAIKKSHGHSDLHVSTPDRTAL